MTTQIISHNANNQLFATRQQALDEISRNNYQVIEESTTMPCSFDERQRNRFDLNRDDEMAINVFVIDNPDNILEPILIGYMSESESVTLYLINTYESYMASDQGIRALTREPMNDIYDKEELLDEAEVELPTGYTFNREFWAGNHHAELVTERDDKGNYVTYLVSCQGMVELHNWGKH